jgi:flagellin
VATAAASQAAMDALDAALDVVGGYRAVLGASASRFERAVAQAQQAMEARSSARGRIMDADMAATLSQQVSARILAESGQAMLQQANALPEQVLDALLGGLRSGG